MASQVDNVRDTGGEFGCGGTEIGRLRQVRAAWIPLPGPGEDYSLLLICSKCRFLSIFIQFARNFVVP